uniref:Cell division protein FtsA n=1 Tax=Candidatus Endecteinascidia fromenterensis TaxID=266021 RepID=G8D469_9GAMM|nr:cell division protein FtsA [Candidatus Endoecteinascidia frumentensis]
MPKIFEENNIISILDIGTSKVLSLIAKKEKNNEINIIGFGIHPTDGLKKGIIINIEKTVESIKKSLEKSQNMAGITIHSVYVNISGINIQGLNSNGIVAVKNKEINLSDVYQVINSAKIIPISNSQKILHILPQEFIVDNQKGIIDPIGISGTRLESKVYLILSSLSIFQNIAKCLYQCNLQILDIILGQFAASYSVLTYEEKEIGTCLIDIGSGITNIIVFINGVVHHVYNLPISGSEVTNDIAHALVISNNEAESLKIQHGLALSKLASSEESIEIKSSIKEYNRYFSIKDIASVIEARYEEIFSLIYSNLEVNNFINKINAGIVLVGGGSKINALLKLAESIFKLPVRLGIPNKYIKSSYDISNIQEDISYATGIGLLLYSDKQKKYRSINHFAKKKFLFWKKIKNWLYKNF